MTAAKVSKVKVAHTEADFDDAFVALVKEAEDAGKSVVKEDGGTFIMEKTATGIVLKTRIA